MIYLIKAFTQKLTEQKKCVSSLVWQMRLHGWNVEWESWWTDVQCNDMDTWRECQRTDWQSMAYQVFVRGKPPMTWMGNVQQYMKNCGRDEGNWESRDVDKKKLAYCRNRSLYPFVRELPGRARWLRYNNCPKYIIQYCKDIYDCTISCCLLASLTSWLQQDS